MRLAFWRKKKTEPQNEVVYSVTTKGMEKAEARYVSIKANEKYSRLLKDAKKAIGER